MATPNTAETARVRTCLTANPLIPGVGNRKLKPSLRSRPRSTDLYIPRDTGPQTRGWRENQGLRRERSDPCP